MSLNCNTSPLIQLKVNNKGGGGGVFLTKVTYQLSTGHLFSYYHIILICPCQDEGYFIVVSLQSNAPTQLIRDNFVQGWWGGGGGKGGLFNLKECYTNFY